MQMIRLAAAFLAMTPVSVSAAVMLQVDGNKTPPCYSGLSACERRVSAPLRSAETSGSIMPDQAVAAIVGLAIVGVALGRRRSGLPEVVS